jgi:HEAT repeat protein
LSVNVSPLYSSSIYFFSVNKLTIPAILQRAVTEGNEENRLSALFLLGGLATPKARVLLISFLDSPYRREGWASAISLGRLKDEWAFSVLQTVLLEGFAASEIAASVEELQAAQEACRLSRQAYQEQGQATFSEAYEDVIEQLRNIDYEWYLRQRSECALVLGAWGNPLAVPKLKEALQATRQMEQNWPDYEGPDESGPNFGWVLTFLVMGL